MATPLLKALETADLEQRLLEKVLGWEMGIESLPIRSFKYLDGTQGAELAGKRGLGTGRLSNCSLVSMIPKRVGRKRA
jgi:hypothetical protein